MVSGPPEPSNFMTENQSVRFVEHWRSEADCQVDLNRWLGIITVLTIGRQCRRINILNASRRKHSAVRENSDLDSLTSSKSSSKILMKS